MAKRKPLVYWEACVQIALFQDEKRAAGEMEGVASVVKQHDAGDIVLCTSVLTRVEVLEGRLTDAQRNRYRTFMLRPDVQEIGVTKRIVERAAQLRTEFHLESLDALHLATALEYEVPVLHTFDGAGKRGGGLLRLANEASLKDRIAIRKPAAPQLALFDATGGPQYPEAQPETAKEQAKPHRTTKKR